VVLVDAIGHGAKQAGQRRIGVAIWQALPMELNCNDTDWTVGLAANGCSVVEPRLLIASV
jgi:hypothetical protein